MHFFNSAFFNSAFSTAHFSTAHCFKAVLRNPTPNIEQGPVATTKKLTAHGGAPELIRCLHLNIRSVNVATYFLNNYHNGGAQHMIITELLAVSSIIQQICAMIMHIASIIGTATLA